MAKVEVCVFRMEDFFFFCKGRHVFSFWKSSEQYSLIPSFKLRINAYTPFVLDPQQRKKALVSIESVLLCGWGSETQGIKGEKCRPLDDM